MLQIYFGDGKGKTTAAIGAALRAAGSGMKVLFIQLLKNGNTGEVKKLKNIDGIEYFLPTEKYTLFSEDEEQKRRLSADYLSVLMSVDKNISNYDMVIIDEALGAVEYGFIEKSLMINLVNKHKEKTEIILTGEPTVKELIFYSDYATEFVCVKHPYSEGIQARKGIEF